jgi:hypothetical protein
MPNSCVLRPILIVTMLAAGCAIGIHGQTPQGFVPLGGHHHLAMSPVQQTDCPLAIRQTTHAMVDAFTGGVLQNAGDKTVVSYKMGWVLVFRNAKRKPEVTVGKIMNVPAGIESGATVVVPAQGVWVAKIHEDAKVVAFFVADVEFADGTHFTSDIDQMAQRAMKDYADLK